MLMWGSVIITAYVAISGIIIILTIVLLDSVDILPKPEALIGRTLIFWSIFLCGFSYTAHKLSWFMIQPLFNIARKKIHQRRL